MRAQGAVEYILMLGVIILITVIVAVNIVDFDSLKFITQTETNLNNIENLLTDVMIKKTISTNGYVQASLMSFRHPLVTNANVTIFNEYDEPCKIIIGTVRSEWVTNSTTCDLLSGPVNTYYSLKCVVSYSDPQNIVRTKTGVCKGIYEE